MDVVVVLDEELANFVLVAMEDPNLREVAPHETEQVRRAIYAAIQEEEE